jgi:phosphoglycerate dehydrogenase-like enzyme
MEWIAARVPDDFRMTALDAQVPQNQVIDAVGDADFLMVYRAKLPDAVVEAAARARLVQLLAAGYDGLNLARLRELNIPCAQNAGVNAAAVADYTVLLMLAVYRRLVLVDRSTREGRWRAPLTGLNTYEMEGKLVGILGFGNIGRKVAARLRGFGARVQYVARSPVAPSVEQELGAVARPFDEVFRTSDVVTVHTPLTAETRNLVSAGVLATMKPTAVLINTSRGEVIDEEAMIRALQEGRLAGAGLDVFHQEPVDPTNRLLALDNVVVSPHSAGTTADTWQRRLDFAFANMRRVRAGEPPLALVTCS